MAERKLHSVQPVQPCLPSRLLTSRAHRRKRKDARRICNQARDGSQGSQIQNTGFSPRLHGCGSCANVCPAKQKALVMTPADKVNETENWEFAEKVRQVESGLNKFSVKGSQFEQPLFEFSGACAGCGETPYVKLITQLFGDRMVIANATAAPPFTAAARPRAPTPPTRTVTVPHGRTACSRTRGIRSASTSPTCNAETCHRPAQSGA